MSQQAFQLTFWMILIFWFFSSPCGSAYLSYQLPANLSWAFCHYKSVIRSKSDIDESPATWSQEPKSMLTFCFQWRTKKKDTLFSLPQPTICHHLLLICISFSLFHSRCFLALQDYHQDREKNWKKLKCIVVATCPGNNIFYSAYYT